MVAICEEVVDKKRHSRHGRRSERAGRWIGISNEWDDGAHTHPRLHSHSRPFTHARLYHTKRAAISMQEGDYGLMVKRTNKCLVNGAAQVCQHEN